MDIINLKYLKLNHGTFLKPILLNVNSLFIFESCPGQDLKYPILINKVTNFVTLENLTHKL